MSDPYDPNAFDKVDERVYEAEKVKALFNRPSVKPFACRTQPDHYLLIFAYTKNDAIIHAHQYTKKKIEKAYEYNLDYGITKDDTFTTFRELRKFHDRVPVVIGEYAQKAYQKQTLNNQMAN